MVMDETRIYVVVAGTIQVPVNPLSVGANRALRTVVQPVGRQIAQACHVVSKLRHGNGPRQTVEFEPITTIILQARDSAELAHVYVLLNRKHLQPEIFSDDNPEYGLGDWPTAVAVFATPKQVKYILNYLPLWGSK